MGIRALSFFAVSLTFVLGIGAVGCAAEPPGADDDDFEEEPTAATEAMLRSGVGCSMRTVTGYRSGAPYRLQIVTVGGEPTAVATAHAFLRWQAAADRAGVSLAIRSGFRTMDEQRYLYNCYQTGRCNNGNLAARPGYSNHQKGEALDLTTTNWSWVARTASQYGFRATVPGERWHYEYRGSDPGGICRGGASVNSDGNADGNEPATVGSDDEPAPQAPAGGACNSATLGREMAEGSCVQSSSTQLWYQCEAGQWYRGVTDGNGPYGRCTTMVGL
jgi:hypothetical protein